MSNVTDRTFNLRGKVVAITGASSGFGHHFAGVLAEAGAKVVLGARRVDMLAARVKEIEAAGGVALSVSLDVNDTESVGHFFDSAENHFGQIDVLINNAGIESGAKTFMMIDEDDWDNVFNTNLKSIWQLSKQFTERLALRQQASAERLSGNIVNIASITAFRAIKGQFPYAVSKAALIKSTEVMALEGAKFGIRVNALAPGYFLTDVSKVLLESDMSDAFRKGIPMRRYGQFDDLNGALLLLTSDASAYMTGSTLVVDGGHICSEL